MIQDELTPVEQIDDALVEKIEEEREQDVASDCWSNKHSRPPQHHDACDTLDTSSLQETSAQQQQSSFSSEINDLSDEQKEVLKVAACLGSFDMDLLQPTTALSEERLTTLLKGVLEKHIIQRNKDRVLEFSSSTVEQDVLGLLFSQQERSVFHLQLGRNLIQVFSEEDELKRHIYHILLQFHCGMDAMTSPEERTAIAGLCLRAIQWSGASNVRAACNYAEFGILLLGPNCWENDYDLSVALYSAAAEVFHCAANYQRVDDFVSAVLENVTCFGDSLPVRATRVHSLSSTNRMTEALEEGLDILRHFGVKFPAKPQKYHAAIDLMKTKQLLGRKTNEMILRMPLMKDADKIAAMQMLNLIFPCAYHIDRVLFALVNLRLVQLSVRYGLSAISSVGFAGYSVMLVMTSKNKEKGYRYSELALELLDKFGKPQYIPRVFYFVYAEAYTFKATDIRGLRSFLLEAYQIGLQSGDVQYALYNSTQMEFGYMLFSGDSIPAVEEKMTDYYKTAVAYKQDTVLLIIRPVLKFLHILASKLERPHQGTAFPDDLTRAHNGKDSFGVFAIHFLQMLLAYLFGDFEIAAKEARELQVYLRAGAHPGFSGVLTVYCLSLLGAAHGQKGLARRRLLSQVKRNLRKLEEFALFVPDNCLHKLNLVQAEVAVVQRKHNVARHMYVLAISRSSELGVSWIRAIASERFACFLQKEGEKSSATDHFREAHSAFRSWGAIAKVDLLEKEISGLF